MAIVWQAVGEPSGEAAATTTQETRAVARTAPGPQPLLEAAELAQWEAQAQALTPAGVALDESAQELWFGRLEQLERAISAPGTSLADRAALAQIELKLVQTGVIAPPEARRCVRGQPDGCGVSH